MDGAHRIFVDLRCLVDDMSGFAMARDKLPYGALTLSRVFICTFNLGLTRSPDRNLARTRNKKFESEAVKYSIGSE